MLFAICLTAAAAVSTPLSTADAPMPVSLAGTCDAALGEVAWSPDMQDALVTSASNHGYQYEPGGGFGRINLWQLFGSFLLLAGTAFVLWPVWGSFAFPHTPFDYAAAAAYGLATPLIGAFPKAFDSLNTASDGTILSQAAKSVNRVRQLTPWFAACLLLLSAAFIGTYSQHATGSSTLAVDAFSGQADLFTGTILGNGTGATSPVIRVDLPYEGQWPAAALSCSAAPAACTDVARGGLAASACHGDVAPAADGSQHGGAIPGGARPAHPGSAACTDVARGGIAASTRQDDVASAPAAALSCSAAQALSTDTSRVAASPHLPAIATWPRLPMARSTGGQYLVEHFLLTLCLVPIGEGRATHRA